MVGFGREVVFLEQILDLFELCLELGVGSIDWGVFHRVWEGVRGACCAVGVCKIEMGFDGGHFD